MGQVLEKVAAHGGGFLEAEAGRLGALIAKPGALSPAKTAEFSQRRDVLESFSTAMRAAAPAVKGARPGDGAGGAPDGGRGEL